MMFKRPLIIFGKSPITDVWQDPKHASGVPWFCDNSGKVYRAYVHIKMLVFDMLIVE